MKKIKNSALRGAITRALKPATRQLLANYPADAPLWRDGDGEPALRCLLAQRRARLNRLAQVLKVSGIDLPAGLLDADPTSLADVLDEFCNGVWKGFARRDTALSDRWRQCEWSDGREARCLTLATDVGIALGERAIACDPQRWAWGVDAYQAHEADGVESFGQVVVLDPTVPQADLSPPILDALDLSYGRYQAHAFDSTVRERFIDGLRSLL
jgi:hypothetical protein